MKQVGILGGLLALSLVGAYVTWTAPDEAPKVGDVLVLRATADELASVTWKDADKTIRLTRPKDASGAYFWVEASERRKVAAAPTGVEQDRLALDPELAEEAEAEQIADAAPADRYEEEQTAFAGSEQAEEVWKAFTPLRALRQLDLADGSLADFGLDDVATRIELEVGGKRTTVELGSEAFGTRNRYARIDGRLYLLDDATVRPLQFAKTRLVERRVHPVAETDLVTLTVQRGADRRELVQRHADDRTKAFWADAGKPDERDAEAGAWVGKLLRLRVRGYDQLPDAASLEPVFAFEVEGKDGKRWPIEVLKGRDGSGVEYYARSGWTRTLVSLTRALAEEAVADLGALFDGVPAADGEPSTPRAPVPGEPTAELDDE